MKFVLLFLMAVVLGACASGKMIVKNCRSLGAASNGEVISQCEKL